MKTSETRTDVFNAQMARLKVLALAVLMWKLIELQKRLQAAAALRLLALAFISRSCLESIGRSTDRMSGQAEGRQQTLVDFDSAFTQSAHSWPRLHPPHCLA